MSTGSGTGTPATAAGAATLSSIRSRVLTQLTAAGSGMDPMETTVTASSLTLTTMRQRIERVLKNTGASLAFEREPLTASSLTLTTIRDRIETVLRNTTGSLAYDREALTASSLTLTTMRDRVETVLQDSGNVIWATGDIDEAIDQAIERYSRVKPDRVIDTITLSAAGREIDISSLTTPIQIEKVWWDYDSSSPGHPPAWRNFQVWPGDKLYIDDDEEPANTDVVRIWHTKAHILNGLGGETSTTFPVEDEAFLIQGAAALCARFRAVELAEQATVDAGVVDRLMDWADKMLEEFDEGLKLRDHTRRQRFDDDDIEEGVRQALERYSRIKPDRAISTITLSAAGREVDISSLTTPLQIEKVWWDYDSSSPGYPPNWRDFRVWPTDILFIEDAEEPQSGDKVRIWYTKSHTINLLDSATATTFPVEDEAFIVQGAAAFAAFFQAAETGGSLEWAKAMLEKFEAGLKLRERTAQQTYDQNDIDEGIRHALEQYSRRLPNHAISTINLSADGREIDISSVTGLLRVERAWWDYDSSDPAHPPNWRHFQVWPGSVLYIDDQTAPSSGDVLRLWYTKSHTINLLDSATATTFPEDDESFLILGAAAFAAMFRASEQSSPSERLMEWSKAVMREFNEGLRQRKSPGYIYSYDQDDIDEAIRWALHRYSQLNPERVITSVTLSADGREVDISSITDYLQVERVWWDYDSADPEYPPKWRDFELWPGDILFVKDGTEPASGEVVRVWYTRKRTLNGLDSASTTSLPDDDETLIVVGAAGFAAQERIQDEESRYVPRKLREWAAARLREFERGLKALADRLGARHSGIAPGPHLDRWDEEEEGWW